MEEPRFTKLRFVHPPRTGGSSITRSWGINRRSGGEYHGHHFPEMPKPEWEFRYGFTRNPWDRVVSLYHLATPEHQPVPKDFQRWVLEGMDGDHTFGARWQEQVCQPTIKWLKGANFIGRFENRQRDLVELSSLLGREVPREHISASPKRLLDYREYYDEKTRLWVAERYHEDVEEFGYAFG